MFEFFNEWKSSIKDTLNQKVDSPYTIISLGTRCYTRTLLTRYQLKKKKSAGELTLPFDFTYYTHSYFITDFLANNFDNFFKGLYYVEEDKQWSNAGKIFFSHETNIGPNDLKVLIDKYVKRIDNFYKEINKDKLLLFLQILDDKEAGEDVERLFEALRRKVSKPFVLAVVDCANVLPVVVSEHINVLRIEKPSEDYDFYSADCYKSKEGKEFEQKIIAFVESIIQNKLKQKVIKYL